MNCEIPIAKTASVPIAEPGQDMTFTVKVPADTAAVMPFPCDLTNVKVTDVLSVEKADNPSNPPKMNFVSGTGPNGEVGTVSADKQTITFANLGTWKPGDPPLIVTIKAECSRGNGTGIMKDEATAPRPPRRTAGQQERPRRGHRPHRRPVHRPSRRDRWVLRLQGVGLTGKVNGTGPASHHRPQPLSAAPVQLSKVLASPGS